MSAVADDPEGMQVLQDALSLWKQLPEDARRRIHLATLPMDDPAENATIVNALQRYATEEVERFPFRASRIVASLADMVDELESPLSSAVEGA